MNGKGRLRDNQRWFRLKPVRSSHFEWREEEGTVVIQDTRSPTGLRGRVIALFRPIRHRDVELDELGSFVWLRCDGKRTVRQIASELKQTFRITQAEAETSLLAFLATLERRGYISLK